ncbi:isoprenylcysteine carboxylmethyltransferase family protein [Tabrizicola sp. TH137]|uniref:methyltransferase family protein n=1 Tax=Tabrizicola sp. TH137 TaxID=2067452 RepID=UPI0020B3FB7E|nr:isoprenylcysteine carboxylmethyltransferase family protein [Tabrizicola sp. TH137]
MPKVVDLPPVWLMAFIGAVWLLDRLLPMPLFGGTGDLLAAVFGVMGAGLFAGALWEMGRARTTVIPHRAATALVTTGVFGLSRNPIYLGDVAFLLAAILWLDVPVGLLLVPLFMRVIRDRFILEEEARLRAGFGAAFDVWAARVRRWL